MYNLYNLLLDISSVVIALLCTYAIKRRTINFLRSKDLAVENYRGNHVPTAGGLILLFPCIAGIIPYYVYGFTLDNIIYVFIVISLALMGFMDDAAGSRHSKGILGHFKAFINGNLTTGFIKAAIGTVIGIIVALTNYGSLFAFFINLIVFVFSLNLINLLDLRPGRAVKGFSFLLVIFLILSGFEYAYLILSIVAAIVPYIKGELMEEYMLGDTGSNLIGGMLGYYAVRALPDTVKLIYAAFLILLNVLAEFYSFSKWIDKVPLLRSIDRLGRRRGGESS